MLQFICVPIEIRVEFHAELCRYIFNFFLDSFSYVAINDWTQFGSKVVYLKNVKCSFYAVISLLSTLTLVCTNTVYFNDKYSLFQRASRSRGCINIENFIVECFLFAREGLSGFCSHKNNEEKSQWYNLMQRLNSKSG